MTNSLDRLSKPLKKEKTKLATIYWLNARDSKKGRLFIPAYDERFLLEFKTKYVYISEFLEKNNAAGNHYHKVKQEILIPLQGEFEIHLVDIETKEKEIIPASPKEHKAIYVKTGVAHKVVSKEDTGVLLVLASNPSAPEDEIEYNIDNS